VLTEAVDRRWCNAVEGETRRRRGWKVVSGGLWVKEYQWTMGKLEEVAMWLEEDGG
jgi:hypothetical protein